MLLNSCGHCSCWGYERPTVASGASTANVWAEVATEAGVTVGTAARVLLEAATEL